MPHGQTARRPRRELLLQRHPRGQPQGARVPARHLEHEPPHDAAPEPRRARVRRVRELEHALAVRVVVLQRRAVPLLAVRDQQTPSAPHRPRGSGRGCGLGSCGQGRRRRRRVGVGWRGAARVGRAAENASPDGDADGDEGTERSAARVRLAEAAREQERAHRGREQRPRPLVGPGARGIRLKVRRVRVRVVSAKPDAHPAGDMVRIRLSLPVRRAVVLELHHAARVRVRAQEAQRVAHVEVPRVLQGAGAPVAREHGGHPARDALDRRGIRDGEGTPRHVGQDAAQERAPGVVVDLGERARVGEGEAVPRAEMEVVLEVDGLDGAVFWRRVQEVGVGVVVVKDVWTRLVWGWLLPDRTGSCSGWVRRNGFVQGSIRVRVCRASVRSVVLSVSPARREPQVPLIVERVVLPTLERVHHPYAPICRRRDGVAILASVPSRW